MAKLQINSNRVIIVRFHCKKLQNCVRNILKMACELLKSIKTDLKALNYETTPPTCGMSEITYRMRADFFFSL
jgi:hypothetical protein